MPTEGVWSMTEEGEFILSEPYLSQLIEVKLTATDGFNNAMFAKLAELSRYKVDELRDEWYRRVHEDLSPMEITDEFIIEALTGDL